MPCRNKFLITVVTGLLGLCLLEGTGHAEFSPQQVAELKRVQDFKVWKLTSVLDLTQQQSTQFFPIYNQLEKQSQEFISTKRRLMQKLDEWQHQRNGNDQSISIILNELKQLETDFTDRKSQLQNDLFKILTPPQQAAYLRFETEFPRMLRELVNKKRRMNQQQGRNGAMRNGNRPQGQGGFNQPPRPQPDQGPYPPDGEGGDEGQDEGDTMDYDNNYVW